MEAWFWVVLVGQLLCTCKYRDTTALSYLPASSFWIESEGIKQQHIPHEADEDQEIGLHSISQSLGRSHGSGSHVAGCASHRAVAGVMLFIQGIVRARLD